MSRLVRFSLVATVLAVSQLAYAQFETATVLGTVRDASGAVIPGATVTLRNTETGIAATVTTDNVGSFQFFNVRIGTYTVRSELQGF